MSRSIRSYFENASESTDVASSKNLNVVNNEHNINADTANGKPLEDHINNAEIETSVEANNTHLESMSASLAQYCPQESFQFPKSLIGKRELRCQHQWFNQFKWLHYDARNDSVFCCHCMRHDSNCRA